MTRMVRLTQHIGNEKRTADIPMPRNFAPAYVIFAEAYDTPDKDINELFPTPEQLNGFHIAIKAINKTMSFLEVVKYVKNTTGWELKHSADYAKEVLNIE